MVPDTLSRDSVEKPLCARFLREIDDPGPEEEKFKAFHALVSISGVRGGPALEDFCSEQ